MLVLAALGGNALLARGQALTAENQRENARVAARALAKIVEAGHDLVITHGNGPQVGLLALQGLAYKPEEIYPLDVMGAETEGMIGYLIEQELENALGHARPVATLLTQIRVDPDDPAFDKPTKFVGPVYDKAQAEGMAERHGWSIAEDGDHWRRVVPSPAPVEIPDLKVIRLLLRHGTIVICAGGGIPVMARPDGSLTGVQAMARSRRALSGSVSEEDGDARRHHAEACADTVAARRVTLRARDQGAPWRARRAALMATTYAGGGQSLAGGGARTIVSPATLYRMKRGTVREKDRMDAAALRRGFDLEDD